MAKVPQSPDEIFDEFTKDLKQCFENDLISVILYGSGAQGEYKYKKSDINFLVILTEDGIKSLGKAMDVVYKWSKRSVAVPLFLTQEYINSSLDSFPIEFLNMKKYHKVVFGGDVLGSIEISKKDLRLKCEEQIKGKLLHLREEYLLTRGEKKRLEFLLAITVPTFVSIFTALLDLKGESGGLQKKDTFLTTAKIFNLDQSIFEKVIRVRNKDIQLTKEELSRLTLDYINEILKLSRIVDKL